MSITVEKSLDQREIFYRLVPQLLADDERLALVIAEIGAAYLEPHIAPEVRPRVVNVGIREQAMIGVAGGMALAGMRPIVHTFPPFLIERPFEQVKLDLGHQGVGAVLVSSGGSYGWPQGGETHFGQRDVALLDTLDGWTVHVPGHVDEVDWMLHSAVAGDDRVYIRLDGISNERPYAREVGFSVLQQGKSGTVVSVGPMTDRVLAAARGRDVTVLHASTIRRRYPAQHSDDARRHAGRALPRWNICTSGESGVGRYANPCVGHRSGGRGASSIWHCART